RVFEARIQHRDDRLCFLAYDDEHHRMAFANLGPGEAKNASAPPKAPGVHHVAYAWRNLGELIDTYKRLKNHGVLPTRPIRHGLTLSPYYGDPDGNSIEFPGRHFDAGGGERLHGRSGICQEPDRREIRSR